MYGIEWALPGSYFGSAHSAPRFLRFGIRDLSSSRSAPLATKAGMSTEIGNDRSYPPPSLPSFAYASSVFEKKSSVTLIPYFASNEGIVFSPMYSVQL